VIEWDSDLEETPNHLPGYLDTEIAPITRQSNEQQKEN